MTPLDPALNKVCVLAHHSMHMLSIRLLAAYYGSAPTLAPRSSATPLRGSPLLEAMRAGLTAVRV